MNQSVGRAQQWRVMLCVYAAMVLLGLDATVTGMVLPPAVRELDGLAQYALLGTVGTVATAVTILFAARLGDGIGRKPVLLISAALMIVASLLSAAAPTMALLIAARGLSGMASGMITAAAVAAPADVFHSPAERIRWQSWSSVIFAAASSAGPLLGGIVIGTAGWRAGFVVVPVAGLAAVGLLLRYPRLPGVHPSPPPMDWRGAALISLATAAPLVALSLCAGDRARLLPAAVLALLAIAAAELYRRHERRVALPFLPLRLLADAQARVLVGGALATGGVMFVLLFYGPLLLQGVVGLPPARAGLLIAPMMLALPVGSLLNGHLFRRLARPERLLLGGVMLLVLGCSCLLGVALGLAHEALIVIGFALAGLGLGMAQPNQAVFMQMLVERRDLGIASGLVSLARSFGTGLGAALVGIAIAQTSLASGMSLGMGLAVLAGIGVLVLTALRLDTTAPAFGARH